MHPKYRPDIDGLRAVAVSAVVIFHAFPSMLPGGYVGVDIFFVISGFLISSIIFEAATRNAFGFAWFYSRRARRLFPALFLVLAATLVTSHFLLLPLEFAQVAKHVAAGAGFVSNIALWMETGYFDTAAETKPLLHLWSLGVEEQFYLVWPVIVLLVYRLRGSMLTWLSLLVVASFALSVTTTYSYPSFAFFLPFTRFWELGLGALLAWSQVGRPQQTALIGLSGTVPAQQGSGILGAVLLIAAFTLLDKETPFPGWAAALPAIGTLLLIAAGPGAAVNRALLSARPFVFIGLISYPLYLWHWPPLAISRTLAGGEIHVGTRLVIVAVSVCLAWLTWLGFEGPLRRLPSRVVPFGLFASVMLVGAAGLLVFMTSGALVRDSTLAFNIKRPGAVTSDALQVASTPESPRQDAPASPRKDSKSALAIAVPPNASPAIKNAEKEPPSSPSAPGEAVDANDMSGVDPDTMKLGAGLFEYTVEECGVSPEGRRVITGCRIDNRDRAVNALWGDSKAGALLPGLIRVSTPDGRWVSMGRGGCSPVTTIRRVSTYADDNGDDCAKANELILQRILGDEGIKNVVLATASRMMLDARYGMQGSQGTPNGIVDGLSNTVSRLQGSGKRVLFVIDNPTLPEPKSCVPRNVAVRTSKAKACYVTLEQHYRTTERYRRLVAQLKTRHPNLVLIDPTSLLCDERADICPMARDGKFLYSYGDHLSDTGNEIVARAVLAAINN